MVLGGKLDLISREYLIDKMIYKYKKLNLDFYVHWVRKNIRCLMYLETL